MMICLTYGWIYLRSYSRNNMILSYVRTHVALERKYLHSSTKIRYSPEAQSPGKCLSEEGQLHHDIGFCYRISSCCDLRIYRLTPSPLKGMDVRHPFTQSTPHHHPTLPPSSPLWHNALTDSMPGITTLPLHARCAHVQNVHRPA